MPDTATTEQTKTTTISETVQQGLVLAENAKAGYKTTEFWMKVAALVLTVLYSTGTIHTEGTGATIAAITATVLGALGYTVCRTWAKA